VAVRFVDFVAAHDMVVLETSVDFHFSLEHSHTGSAEMLQIDDLYGISGEISLAFLCALVNFAAVAFS
jgi:hypothetical protein